MDDDRTKLERMLRDRAEEIPYRREAPPALLGRARRRVARNAISSLVAVGIIVAGASAGLESMGALRAPIGPATRGPAPADPRSPSSSAPVCTVGDIRATAALDGAAGSVVGSIGLTNFSDTTCALKGRPVVTLFGSSGHPLPVTVVAVAPQWLADGSSPPPGWPVVRLRPGSAAAVRVRWSNACPQRSEPALWRVSLTTDGQTLDVFGADGTPPPSCSGPTEPSILEVGPVEPSALR